MSVLAIVALTVIALTLIPAIILVTPAPSRSDVPEDAAVASSGRHAGIQPAPNPTGGGERSTQRAMVREQERVQAPTSRDATPEQAVPSRRQKYEASGRFMLTPHPDKPRRYVTHSGGFADIPLRFEDGKGSHYTTRWHLCIN